MRALQLFGWYAILVESSGLSVARRSTKTNQNLNHDLRFRLDRCLADPSRNHPALHHRITSATRQTPQAPRTDIQTDCTTAKDEPYNREALGVGIRG